MKTFSGAGPALLLSLFAFGCEEVEEEPVCDLTPPSRADWRLHTEGSRVVDVHGRTVVLRGVNAGGRAKFAPYLPFDYVDDHFEEALASYLDRTLAWGINTLRVPFSWAAVEPEPGVWGEEFLYRQGRLLDEAWARGLYTIVDFHQDVYAEAFCGDGFPPWTLPEPVGEPHHDCPDWFQGYTTGDEVQAAFDRLWSDETGVRTALGLMWQEMLERHRDRPGVIGFEILNEPGWGTADMTEFTSGTLTQFTSEMATLFNQEAQGALVFFDATGFDAVLAQTSLQKPSGENLVFAPHYYQFSSLSGGSGDPDGVAESLQNWADTGVEWDLPVLLGEFGATQTDLEAGPYLEAHYDAFDALGMHATQWEYSDSTEVWNEELLSLVSADGLEMASLANPMTRVYPVAIAGESYSFSFDASPRQAELNVPSPDTGGVTEISVPSRLYATGVKVAVEGGCAVEAMAEEGRVWVKSDGGVPLRVVIGPP